MQQSTRFLPVSSSTLFYQPLCSFLTCLSTVFTVLQRFFEPPCHSRAWEIFLCVGRTLLFELPPASTSRRQSVHCPLPVFEGTHPLAHPSQPLHPPIIITHPFALSTLPFFCQPMSTIYPSLFRVFFRVSQCPCTMHMRFYKFLPMVESWSWVRLRVSRLLVIRRGRRFV